MDLSNRAFGHRSKCILYTILTIFLVSCSDGDANPDLGVAVQDPQPEDTYVVPQPKPAKISLDLDVSTMSEKQLEQALSTMKVDYADVKPIIWFVGTMVRRFDDHLYEVVERGFKTHYILKTEHVFSGPGRFGLPVVVGRPQEVTLNNGFTAEMGLVVERSLEEQAAYDKFQEKYKKQAKAIRDRLKFLRMPEAFVGANSETFLLLDLSDRYNKKTSYRVPGETKLKPVGYINDGDGYYKVVVPKGTPSKGRSPTAEDMEMWVREDSVKAVPLK